MKWWNQIEQYFKRNYLRFLERLFARQVQIPQFINFSNVKSILVVRQHDQLGDFLLATPVLRALRMSFPDARIGVVVRSYVAEVLEHHPHVDEVLVVHEALSGWSPAGFWRFLRRWRSGWDLAIVLNTVSHSLTSDLIAYFSGARYILGSEHKIFPGCRRNFFYNLLAPYWDEPRHQTERNLDIVRHIEVDTDDLREEIHLTGRELQEARQQLQYYGLDTTRLVIGIHPGAGKIPNRWPVTRFVELAQELVRRFQAQILLFWGPNEEDLKEAFLLEADFTPILIAPTRLRQLAAYFRQCHALVCNDTGVMHLAAAVQVPLVAVFGPTDPEEWKPIGENFIGIRGAGHRTETVSVQQVYEALCQLLGDRLPASLTEVAKPTDASSFDISESKIETYVNALQKKKGIAKNSGEIK